MLLRRNGPPFLHHHTDLNVSSASLDKESGEMGVIISEKTPARTGLICQFIWNKRYQNHWLVLMECVQLPSALGSLLSTHAHTSGRKQLRECFPCAWLIADHLQSEARGQGSQKGTS